MDKNEIMPKIEQFREHFEVVVARHEMDNNLLRKELSELQKMLEKSVDDILAELEKLHSKPKDKGEIK